MGLKDGIGGAIQDYLIKVLKIREQIDENYTNDLNQKFVKSLRLMQLV